MTLTIFKLYQLHFIFVCLIVHLCLCVFSCILRKPPHWPTSKHYKIWLCRTDYNQGHCYSSHPCGRENSPIFHSQKYRHSLDGFNPSNRCVRLSTSGLYKTHFCHFSQPTTSAFESNGWANCTCRIFLLCGTKYPYMENDLNQAKRRGSCDCIVWTWLYKEMFTDFGQRRHNIENLQHFFFFF